MTSKVKMVALDTFHTTSIRAEPLVAGEEFSVAEAEAKELEDRGLARRSETPVKPPRSR